MQCPFCNHENIEGVDQCAQCNADLADLNTGREESDIELDLLRRPLGDLVTQDYATASPDLTVREVVRLLNDNGQHCAIVLEGERIAGIFTERDVLLKLAGQFEERADAPVAEYMTPNPATLRYDAPVAFGLNRMMVGGYRHIPIVRDGVLAGVVSVRAILAFLADRCGDGVSGASST